MTKDGLVRVERAGRHVGTLKQSRWGWLAATYAAEVMCEALPSWIAGVGIWELEHLDIMDICRYLYIYTYLLCVLRYLDIHLLMEHIHLLMEHIHVWI